MKSLNNLLSKKTAQNLSAFMVAICNILIGVLIMVFVLSLFGRLQYNLITPTDDYPDAIYAEEDHDFSSRFLTVSANDELRIITKSTDGKIDIVTYIAVVLMFALQTIPMAVAFFFLSRVFVNVAKGEIFIKKNANYILCFGIIQALLAVLLPFLKLLIVFVVNMVVEDSIHISAGSEMLNQLIPAVAFMVAAYIISYGVDLQDEVDSTL